MEYKINHFWTDIYFSTQKGKSLSKFLKDKTSKKHVVTIVIYQYEKKNKKIFHQFLNFKIKWFYAEDDSAFPLTGVTSAVAAAPAAAAVSFPENESIFIFTWA